MVLALVYFCCQEMHFNKIKSQLRIANIAS
jgi:hypothetical protein